MNKTPLLTEGDVNLSPFRAEWIEGLDHETNELLQSDARYFLHQSLSTPCLNVIESAEGIYITDIQGKKYMDFHGNNVHQVGHRNPYVIEKVKAQLDQLPFCPRRYTNQPIIELANRLTGLMPAGLSRVLFCPGGTSAIGMALKLARVITGKTKVVSYVDSFHGASLDAIAAGGEAQFKKYMGEFPDTINIPAPDNYRLPEVSEATSLAAIESIFKENKDVGAFIAETVRNTDVQIPSYAYWKKIRALCNEYKVLLILDEIPIAFGRTGKMFAFEHFAIEPDILCLGKGLGAGIIPMAGIIVREEYNIAEEVSLGHYTFEKNPLGAAAGLAMLDFIDQHNLPDQVKSSEAYLHKALTGLKNQYPVIGDIRGIGLLWGIELVKDPATKERDTELASRVMYRCLEKGLSFKVSQGNVLQWVPPLTIRETELQEAVDILEKALTQEI